MWLLIQHTTRKRKKDIWEGVNSILKLGSGSYKPLQDSQGMICMICPHITWNHYFIRKTILSHHSPIRFWHFGIHGCDLLGSESFRTCWFHCRVYRNGIIVQRPHWGQHSAHVASFCAWSSLLLLLSSTSSHAQPMSLLFFSILVSFLLAVTMKKRERGREQREQGEKRKKRKSPWAPS